MKLVSLVIGFALLLNFNLNVNGNSRNGKLNKIGHGVSIIQIKFLSKRKFVFQLDKLEEILLPNLG